MKARTLHKIDDELDNLVMLEAVRHGWSWNETAKNLLGEAVGLRQTRKTDFFKYLGLWNKNEAREMTKNLEESEKIYKGDW